MGMSEEPLTLEVPRWVWPLVVLALLFTAWAALYIYLGPLATGPVVAAAIVAFAFWMATTYRQPRARRVLPGYIVLLIVLVLQGMEQWAFGYAGRIAEQFPQLFAPPVVWSAELQLGVFTLGTATLLLFAAVGIFFHHPLGNYGAWLACSLAVVGGLSLYGAQALVSGLAYMPGMAMGLVAIVLGLLVGTQLLRIGSEEEVMA
jgi:hypothetical protein